MYNCMGPIPDHLRKYKWYAPHQAYLRDLGLAHHDPGDAKPRRANLSYADLACEILHNLTGADICGSDLSDAILRGATMPDGREWEAYQLDHMAGICHTPEAVERANRAWGNHEWDKCPMHAALNVTDLREIGDAETRLRVACWLALYDSDLLPAPS